MKNFTIVLITFSFICAGYFTCLANTINVPADQPSIQEGINAAVNGDVVLVQPGTYIENINFNGKNITVASLFFTTQDTTYILQTIIDGNQNGSVVIFNHQETQDAVLNGFTITNGSGTNNGSVTLGGGIYLKSYSSPKLENLLIIGNNAYHGGGIWCWDNSHPRLENSTITDNFAESDGGGTVFQFSSPYLENVKIIGNHSLNVGGGLLVMHSNLTVMLKNVEIENNTAGSSGGGIYATDVSLNLENVTIKNNSGSGGGGIRCDDCYLTLEDVNIIDNTGGGIHIINSNEPCNIHLVNVTIKNNTAGSGGGIYCKGNSNMYFDNVTIANNSAIYGGGIYCISEYEEFSSNLKNLAIIGNTAEIHGGGIYLFYSSSPLENITIAGNAAGENGGGIYCRANSEPVLKNCILWNDTPQEIFLENSDLNATYSDIENGWQGEGNINTDPLFSDPENGNYHLQWDSPCIDAGDPSSPYDPDGTIADMGAYYYDQLQVILDADFEAVPTCGFMPLTVQFTDLSWVQNTIISFWQWDFDNDGTIDSEEQNPEWIYTEPGTYSVSLTVSDGEIEDTEVKEDYITVNPIYEQDIVLSEGYSFVSSHIIAENPDMLNILQNNLTNIEFVRNNEGQMLVKIWQTWVNNIGNWITTEAYLFKMNSDNQLTISGAHIDPQTPINLTTGYQMISYLPAQPNNALDMLEGILENLHFVRNTGGFVIQKIGPVWVNSIGDMQPGEGYLVKMNAPDVLIYPQETKSALINNYLNPEHFIIENSNPYDPVWTIYFEQGTLCVGDEIAIYDGEILAGSGVEVSDNILENAIPVFSNLYEAGNKPIIKVWNKSENTEYILSEYTFSNPYRDAWMEDVFPAEDGEYSLLHFSTTGILDENVKNDISIYPNPTTGIITIGNPTGFQNLSGLGLEITDITGKIVFQSKIINYKSSIEIDLSMFEKGIYFISFSGKDFNQVKKIVVQ